MELQTLARPYARAVFEVARDGKALAPWGEFLTTLGVVVHGPQVKALIGSPALSREQLADVLTGAFAGAGQDKLTQWPQMRALLQLLVQNHRLWLAPAVAELFAALRAQAESRIAVQITSAVKVESQQAEQLSAAIGKRLARTVEIHWDTDAELLGCAVIRAGDLVIDGSLKGELERLSQTLTH